MAYIYQKVDELENTNKVGTKQCVALLQHYSYLPLTAKWKEGLVVSGNLSVAKGTAIATFVDGVYKSNSTGNHAAYYISQDTGGIYIMDQWADDTKKPKVSKRYLRKKGKIPGKGFIDPSNNADAYSVID